MVCPSLHGKEVADKRRVVPCPGQLESLLSRILHHDHQLKSELPPLQERVTVPAKERSSPSVRGTGEGLQRLIFGLRRII